MKRCAKCLLTKPTNEFYTNKRFNDGFTSKCKECLKAEAVIRYHQTHISAPCKYCKDPKDRQYGQYCTKCAKWLTRQRQNIWKNKNYRKNKGIILQARKEYYQKNALKITAQKREYYQKKVLAY